MDDLVTRAAYTRLLNERNEFAERIGRLEAEQQEDQGVIRVWRRRAEAAEAEVVRLTALLREAGDALTWAQTHLDSVGLHSTAVDEAVARIQEPRT